MDSNTLVYLLSVSNNFSDTLHIAGNWLFFFTVVGYLAVHIKHWVILGNAEGFYNNEKVPRREQEMERFKGVEPGFRKLSLKLLFTVLVLWTSGACFPDTESVLKAYALIEGSKVLNAENAEAAAEAVGKRFDKFLDILDRTVTNRPAAAKPAPTGDQ